jgi:hypothetical protein
MNTKLSVIYPKDEVLANLISSLYRDIMYDAHTYEFKEYEQPCGCILNHHDITLATQCKAHQLLKFIRIVGLSTDNTMSKFDWDKLGSLL